MTFFRPPFIHYIQFSRIKLPEDQAGQTHTNTLKQVPTTLSFGHGIRLPLRNTITPSITISNCLDASDPPVEDYKSILHCLDDVSTTQDMWSATPVW